MYTTIVVGHDGSEHGERALAHAATLAKDAHARVVVVHVVELVGGKGGMVPMAADEPDVHGRLELEVKELQSDGVNAELVTRTVRLGGPAHEIVAEADAIDADLIVVGARGHSVLSQIVLGSVPLRLLHIATCPVLVVPPAAHH